jgi:drug/metabolite transporter (DMT)-like permease
VIVLTFPSGTRANAWRMQPMTVRRFVSLSNSLAISGPKSLTGLWFCWRRFLWILPLSLFSVMTKVLTYWSYDAVPIAFAHTCKASQPIFNVILAYLIYNSKFSLATYVALVPIVLGVVLASVSEMGMNVREPLHLETTRFQSLN